MNVLPFKRRSEMSPEELEAVRARDRASEAIRKRSARKRPERAQTQAVNRLAKGTLRKLTMLYPPRAEDLEEHPRTRGDCVGASRPCPWVSCRYHLALDVSETTGAIKVVFPSSTAEGHEVIDDDVKGVIDPDLETMPDTCALDVADRDETTLEEVGRVMNITRERVRQLENRALQRIARRSAHELQAFAGDDASPFRKLARAALQVVPTPTGWVEKGEVAAAVGDERAKIDRGFGVDLASPDEELDR